MLYMTEFVLKINCAICRCSNSDQSRGGGPYCAAHFQHKENAHTHVLGLRICKRDPGYFDYAKKV